MSWEDDRYCIACGENNPIGMKLKFEIKDDEITTRYAFPKEFQGYKDTVHGGMLALLLDEVMVNLPWKKLNVPVVSAELKIRLKKPMRIGKTVVATAKVVKQKGRLYYVEGKAVDEAAGTVVAEGEAVCVKVDLTKLNI